MTGRYDPISLDLGQVDVIIQRIVKNCLHLPGNQQSALWDNCFAQSGLQGQ